MTQLDLLDGGQRPTKQELWDWKANVRRGVQFILGEKYNMVNNHFEDDIEMMEDWNDLNPENVIQGHADQIEGTQNTITYTHSSSPSYSFNLGNNPTGNNRSFIDATWIKNYNGSSGGTNGYPGYYYVLKQFGNNLPFWDLHRINSNGDNYVGAVSNRNP